MKKTREGSLTVAGWREFRENSLPCVGAVDVTDGFVPYTGRRPENHLSTSPALGFSVAARELSEVGTDRSALGTRRLTCHRGGLHQEGKEGEEEEDAEGSDQPPEETSDDTSDSTDSEGGQRLTPQSQRVRSQRRYSQHNYQHHRHPLHHHHHHRYHQLRNFPVRNADQGFTAYHPRSEGSNSQLLRAGLQSIFSQTRALPLCTAVRANSSALSVQVPTTDMALPPNNSPPLSPFGNLAFSPPSSSSLFSITPQAAAAMVKHLQKDDDSQSCYFIHLTLRPLFSEDVIPGACLRKLPRLVNGIPLGAGVLTRDQLDGIKWRMIEGGHSTLTFISSPLFREEAEESKNSLKDRLMKQAQAVFGDMTVKASVILSKCIDYGDDLVLNDIAINIGEGLHFRD